MAGTKIRELAASLVEVHESELAKLRHLYEHHLSQTKAASNKLTTKDPSDPSFILQAPLVNSEDERTVAPQESLLAYSLPPSSYRGDSAVVVAAGRETLHKQIDVNSTGLERISFEIADSIVEHEHYGCERRIRFEAQAMEKAGSNRTWHSASRMQEMLVEEAKVLLSSIEESRAAMAMRDGDEAITRLQMELLNGDGRRRSSIRDMDAKRNSVQSMDGKSSRSSVRRSQVSQASQHLEARQRAELLMLEVDYQIGSLDSENTGDNNFISRHSRHSVCTVDTSQVSLPLAIKKRLSKTSSGVSGLSTPTRRRCSRFSPTRGGERGCRTVSQSVTEALHPRYTSCTQASTNLTFELRHPWSVDQEVLEELDEVKLECCGGGIFENHRRGSELSDVDHNVVRGDKHPHRASALSTSSFPTFRWTLHPLSNKRLVWDVLCLFSAAYDLVMVPMHVFGLPNDWFLRFMDLGTAIFWTFDVLLSFFTGVWIKDVLVMEISQIAKRYAQTWLCVDLTIVLPEWMSLLLGSAFSVSFLRAMRATRLLRLLRLARVKQLALKLIMMTGSQFLMEMGGILLHLLVLLVVSHYLGCVWYYIGEISDGWSSAESVKSKSVSYRYILSIHWSITQFHGESDIFAYTFIERTFAVVTVIVALLFFSWFVSSFTNHLSAVQNKRQEAVEQNSLMRMYCAEHHLPRDLVVRVQTALERHTERQRRMQIQDAKFLQLLPPDILMDIHQEARVPILKSHRFFLYLQTEYPRVVRQACHEAVHQVPACKDLCLFAAGDSCSRTLFVEEGQLAYELDRLTRHSAFVQTQCIGDQLDKDDTVILMQGHWISEAALWLNWTNKGTLTIKSDCLLLAVLWGEWSRIMLLHGEPYDDCLLYANAFQKMAEENGCTDLGPNTQWRTPQEAHLHWLNKPHLKRAGISDLGSDYFL